MPVGHSFKATHNALQCVFTEGCTHGIPYDAWFWFQLLPPYVTWAVLAGLMWTFRNRVMQLIPSLVPGIRLRFRKHTDNNATQKREPIVDLNFESAGRMILPEKKWMIFSLMIPLFFIVWYIWDIVFVQRHASYLFPTNLCHDGWDCFYHKGSYRFFSWPHYTPLKDCSSQKEQYLQESFHFYKCYNWHFGFSEMMACAADVVSLMAISIIVTVHKCSFDIEETAAKAVEDMRKLTVFPSSHTDTGETYSPLALGDGSPAKWKKRKEDFQQKANRAWSWVAIWLLFTAGGTCAAFYFNGEYVTTVAGLLSLPSFFLFLASLTRSRHQVLLFLCEKIQEKIDNPATDNLESAKVGAFMDNIDDLSFATRELLMSQAAVTKALLEKYGTPEERTSGITSALETAHAKAEELLTEEFYRNKKGKPRSSLPLETQLLASHEIVDAE